MSPDRPKWLRDDGADERLVNPKASLVRYFHHYEGDDWVPYQEKAAVIEQQSPEFVQALLHLSDQLMKLDVLSRITKGEMPSSEELNQHTALVTAELKLFESYVTKEYGSVETFMEWWMQS